MWKTFRQNKIVKFLSSLKLAVCVIVSLILLMVWGTFTESIYNTVYAQWQVYLSPIFIAVEILLFLNILFAALVRLPFKKRLSGFYTIHAGLLTILIGAAITGIYGIDGSIRLFPNQPNNTVIINEPTFYAFYNRNHLAHPVEFIEPLPKVVRKYSQKNKPFMQILDYDIFLDRYLPFSSPKHSWKPHPDKNKKSRVLGIELANAMFTQNVELSTFDRKNLTKKMGPLTLMLMPNISSTYFEKVIKQDSTNSLDENPHANLLDLKTLRSGPHVIFFKDNRMGFGKGKEWQYSEIEVNKDVSLPWMGFKLTVNRLIDNKFQHTEWYYDPPMGSESKRHFSALMTLKHRYNPDDNSTFWIGDTALKKIITKSGFSFDFMIGNKIQPLPFMIELDRFNMDTNPGTKDPASYESFVKVKGIMESKEAHIFMNNPLKKDKFTFYQASYFPLKDGKTFGSVLSVNYDPGRATKYIGSILLVLGSIVHFTIRSLNGKKKIVAP